MSTALPDLLKSLRAKSGLSLAQTAARLHEAGVTMSRTSVHNWEQGATKPPRVALDALGTAWDLDLSERTQIYMAAGYIVQLNAGAGQ
jgi:transcriptional regulator with XRE-family HTH domain